MGTMAKWYGKVFSVGPKRVVPITGFSTTYAMKQDTNDDTSGTEKTNTRGRAPEEPTFTVKYLAAAGASPRTEFTDWRSLVGKKDWLYIGSTKYGVNKFELVSAAVSDVMLDNQGRTIQAVVMLQFKEDLPTGKKKTSTTKSSKTAAKNAKASKDDKKLKNPYGTGRNTSGTVKGAELN